MLSFYRVITYTKLLRIGTQQFNSYIHCRFQTVFSPQIIILCFMSQQKINAKRKIAYKKQTLEHKCVLQESCKTVRRWQRSILLVNGRSLRRRSKRLEKKGDPFDFHMFDISRD
mgnify:CR=1 FL=1